MFDRNEIHRHYTKSSPIAEAYLARLLYPVQQRIMEIGVIPWIRENIPQLRDVSNKELEEADGADFINDFAGRLIADALRIGHLDVILPWYIFRAIMREDFFINLFNFQQYRHDKYEDADILLPVTITINGNSFAHKLTREQFLGMALAAYEIGDVQLSMFGADFDYENYFNGDNLVFPYNRMYDLTYIADYNGRNGIQLITFDSPLFLQGYLSICEWTYQIGCANRFTNIRQDIKKFKPRISVAIEI